MLLSVTRVNAVSFPRITWSAGRQEVFDKARSALTGGNDMIYVQFQAVLPTVGTPKTEESENEVPFSGGKTSANASSPRSILSFTESDSFSIVASPISCHFCGLLRVPPRPLTGVCPCFLPVGSGPRSLVLVNPLLISAIIRHAFLPYFVTGSVPGALSCANLFPVALAIPTTAFSICHCPSSLTYP